MCQGTQLCYFLECFAYFLSYSLASTVTVVAALAETRAFQLCFFLSTSELAFSPESAAFILVGDKFNQQHPRSRL